MQVDRPKASSVREDILLTLQDIQNDNGQNYFRLMRELLGRVGTDMFIETPTLETVAEAADGRKISIPPLNSLVSLLKANPEIIATFFDQYLQRHGTNAHTVQPILHGSMGISRKGDKNRQMARLIEDLGWNRYLEPLKPEEREMTLESWYDFMMHELVNILSSKVYPDQAQLEGVIAGVRTKTGV